MKISILTLFLSFLLQFTLFSVHAQCIVNDTEAFNRLQEIDSTDMIAGKWNVNLRGTMFYKTNIMQSDYEAYELYWYLLPKGDGYEICGTPGFEKELISGVIINDEAIDGQFFFLANNGDDIELSMGKMVTDSILSFHFKAPEDYIRKNFEGQIQDIKIDDVNLLWEYILTKE